jgi:hypothetical protein
VSVTPASEADATAENEATSCSLSLPSDAVGKAVDTAPAEPVAGAFEGEHVGVVGDAVDHGCGDGLVSEHAAQPENGRLLVRTQAPIHSSTAQDSALPAGTIAARSLRVVRVSAPSGMLNRMSDDQPSVSQVATQVVVNFAAGLAGYLGPGPGALAAGAAPMALVGLDYISSTIGSRRLGHATETLTDAATEYGAKSTDEFVAFVEAAVSDEGRQELLARALTIAQDTSMRDKRRALGRVVAQATSDIGTKVDRQMVYLRVIDDLDEPHVRLLRLMTTNPPHQDAVNRQREKIGEAPVRQWHPSDLGQADPGIAEVVWSLLPVLARHGLISGGYDVITWAGHEPEYVVTPYGEWFLTMLSEPEQATTP